MLAQATSPARRDTSQASGRSSSSGQYLPGLAPSTELRKRVSELRQQQLAKLQRLAGGRAAASSGARDPAVGEQMEIELMCLLTCTGVG